MKDNNFRYKEKAKSRKKLIFTKGGYWRDEYGRKFVYGPDDYRVYL